MRSILFEIDKQIKSKDIEKYKDGYINKDGNSLDKILYCEQDFTEEFELKWNEICEKLKPAFKYLLFAAVVIGLCSLICWFWGNTMFKSLSIPLFSGLGFISAPTIFIKLFEEQIKNISKTIFSARRIKTYTSKPSFSPEQFDEIFEDLVRTITIENKKKVLIIFDNLDRCEPKYAYETLSAIKTFMDKENCFYLIPCDDTAIRKYLVLSYGIQSDNTNFSKELGYEFFDKLFNTYIRIPKLEEVDRDRFIEEQLKQLNISEALETKQTEIKQILYYGYKGATPRQIKRFLNDFSSYYLLAKNIDFEKRFLIKDLALFAIMMVIKQRWSNIEENLIQYPNLFDYDNNNQDLKDQEYDDFISKVKIFLPQEMPSLTPFIYLKETVNEQFINSMLREGSEIENINASILKRLNTECENIINKNEIAFILNASKSIFNSSLNEQNKIYKKQLLQVLGTLLVMLPNNFSDFLENIINNLDKFILTIPDMYKQDVQKIKDYLINQLRINTKNKISKEGKKAIFKLLIQNDKIFTPSLIAPIFTDIKELTQADELIQEYVKFACKNNKANYITEKFINFLVNSISTDSFSENAKQCIFAFKHSDFPNSSKMKLAEKIIEQIKYLSSHFSENINNIDRFNNISKCLYLLEKDSFAKDKMNNFNSDLYALIGSQMIQYQNLIDPGIDILLESLNFITNDSAQNFANTWNNYLQHESIITKKIQDFDFVYFEYAFNYPNVKQAMLANINIAQTIYKNCAEKIGAKYQLYLSDTQDLNNLKVFINILNDTDVDINRIEFRNYVINTYYDNTNLEKSMNLFELLSQNDYKILEKDILKIKNRLIDFYKENPTIGLEYLNLIKKLLSEKTFNKEFLYPLFSNIKSRLEEANSVTDYCNLYHFVSESFTSEYSEVLKELTYKLLEDNQELVEYELGLRIIKALKDFSKIDVNIFVENLKDIEGMLNDNLKQQILLIYPDFNNIKNKAIENQSPS